jgi:hypothetical protein
MAEDQWKQLQESLQFDITRAFNELRDRWRGIWDQEGLRWNAAVNHYQYAMNQEGRWTHEWISKPAAARVEGMKQAVEGMREATDTRLPWEAYSGYGSYMSGPPPERRGEVRSEQFATELAESSRRTLERRLAEVEAWQALYTPKDYQYWDAGEEAKQIRAAMTDPVRREAYVQWVVRGAIETGIKEGYPLRDPRALEDRLRREEGVPPRVSQAESKLQGIRPAEIEALHARFETVAPQLSTTAKDQIQERLHELRSDQRQPTLAERADRLADRLEETQRQGLVITGEQSHTEDQKQRQRH